MEWVTLNNALACWTNGLYRTPNPNQQSFGFVKNHLAENDWGGPAVTEFRGSHGMD